MLTVFSTDHLLRSPRTELYGGELVRPHESPERAQIVLDRIRAQGLGEVIAPVKFGMAPLLRVHDPAFIEFLKQAWSEWVAAGNRGEAIPDCWPARRMAQRCPNSITGKLGYYAMAAETLRSRSAGRRDTTPGRTFITATAPNGHFLRMIRDGGLPTLFVMEGGYAVGEIGINVVNVLTGFES